MQSCCHHAAPLCLVVHLWRRRGPRPVLPHGRGAAGRLLQLLRHAAGGRDWGGRWAGPGLQLPRFVHLRGARAWQQQPAGPWAAERSTLQRAACTQTLRRLLRVPCRRSPCATCCGRSWRRASRASRWDAAAPGRAVCAGAAQRLLVVCAQGGRPSLHALPPIAPAVRPPILTPAAQPPFQPAPPPHCPQVQPDKVNNEGLGHTSPLDIPIPGAQPGEDEDYYYHDRQAGRARSAYRGLAASVRRQPRPPRLHSAGCQCAAPCKPRRRSCSVQVGRQASAQQRWTNKQRSRPRCCAEPPPVWRPSPPCACPTAPQSSQRARHR